MMAQYHANKADYLDTLCVLPCERLLRSLFCLCSGTQQLLRARLKGCSDVEHITARIALRQGRPRELEALRQTLYKSELTTPVRHGQSALLTTIFEYVRRLTGCAELLGHCLLDEPAALIRDGGAMRDGSDSALDELRAIQTNGEGFYLIWKCAKKPAPALPTCVCSSTTRTAFTSRLRRANRTRCSLTIGAANSATKVRGACLNDRCLRVGKRTRLQDWLVSTGFPYRPGDKLKPCLNMLGEVMSQWATVRHALDSAARIEAGENTDGNQKVATAPMEKPTLKAKRVEAAASGLPNTPLQPEKPADHGPHDGRGVRGFR